MALLRALMAAAALLASPASTGTAAAAPQAESAPQTAGQAVRLIRALIAAGEYEEARAVMAAFHPDSPDHAVRTQFVEGLIASGRGDYAGAVAIYRDILADRADLKPVRIELARALYLMGEDDGARFHAETLIAAGVDERLGGALSNIVRAIDNRRPLRFRGEFTLLPSTNINNGTDNHTVALGNQVGVINPQARRKSGVGARLGGQVLLRYPLGQDLAPELALIGAASGRGEWYPGVDRVQLFGDATAGVEKRFGDARLSISGLAGFETLDEELVAHRIGAVAEADVSLAPGTRALIAPRAVREIIHLDRRRDGWSYGAYGQVDHTLAPGRFVRVLGSVTADRRDLDRFSYDEGRIGLGGYNEFPFGVTAYAQASYAKRRYADLYPGLAEPREDDRINAVLVLTKRDISLFGLAPQITYRFERILSNAAFSDTTTHGIELKVTREF